MPGFGFDLADIRQARRHPIEYRAAQLEVGDLPAAEHHRHLHLVAVTQELARVACLEVEIVVVDSGTVLHFLELDDVLLLLGGAGRLGFLELELPVVHDLDDGRARSGRHFHEIETAFLRRGERLFDREHSELLAVSGDDADRADPDHAIDAGPLFTIACGQCVCLHGGEKRTGTRPNCRVPVASNAAEA
jgi:hypothetical protein